MREGVILVGSVMKLRILVEFSAVINHANFHVDYVICFCASLGQNKGFSL
jgi:hypothetical protein